jgi:hypothetical protein
VVIGATDIEGGSIVKLYVANGVSALPIFLDGAVMMREDYALRSGRPILRFGEAVCSCGSKVIFGYERVCTRIYSHNPYQCATSWIYEAPYTSVKEGPIAI